MNDALVSLGSSDLRVLANAVRNGRVGPPYLPSVIERCVNRQAAAGVSAALMELSQWVIEPQAIAPILDMLADSASQRTPLEDVIDLVTTGPEAGASQERSISVCEPGVATRVVGALGSQITVAADTGPA